MENMRKTTIANLNTANAAGNVMTELKEADLKNFSAGAGQARGSGGVICSLTAECNAGTLVFFCC